MPATRYAGARSSTGECASRPLNRTHKREREGRQTSSAAGRGRCRNDSGIGQPKPIRGLRCRTFARADSGFAGSIGNLTGPMETSPETSARVRSDELERRLQERLDALGPAPRAELLHVLMLPDFERADRIGEFWGYPQSRAFAELLIDCEEDRTLRAVLVGMLREADRSGPS